MARAGTIHPHPTARTYLLVWIGLLGLTALTVALAEARLGWATILSVLIIATVKSGLVAAFFMHLRYERVRLYVGLLLITLIAFVILLLILFADIAVRY